MNALTVQRLPRRPSVQSEEEQAWISFYRRARHQPAVAAEVLVQLDLDPEMKRAHLALYLCCRESLRLHEERAARDARIGLAVRWIAAKVFAEGPALLARGARRTGGIVLACLPGAQPEPAEAKVRRLAADPKVRAARSTFRSGASSTEAAREEAVPADAAGVHPSAPAGVRAVGGA